MPTPIPPASNRLVGLLLVLSGLLMGLGLLLKVGLSIYGWVTSGGQSLSATLLSANLLGLLASGLLMRWGLNLRRGSNSPYDPDADEIL